MKKKLLVIAAVFLTSLAAAQDVEVFIPTGHTWWLYNAVYSPDGKYLVSCANNGFIKIWDAVSFRAIHTLEERAKEIAFSPDGKQFVSSGDGKGMKIWDTATGREIAAFADLNFTAVSGGSGWAASGPGGSALFSPDGKHILSEEAQGSIKLWDIASGKVIRESKITGRDPVYSPDGTKLLTHSGNTLKLWDAASETELRSFEGHSEAVSCAVFGPDGKTLVSGSFDKTLRVWDTETAAEPRVLTGHSERIRGVSVSPDGSKILSFSDYEIRMWNAASGETLFWARPYQGYDGGINSVRFSPDGRSYVTTNGLFFSVDRWDAESGSHSGTYFQNSSQVESISMSSDGKLLALGCRDKRIRIVDMVSGRQLYMLGGHSDGVYSLSFSRDGTRLASGGGGAVKLWDTQSGEDLGSFSAEKPVLSPDGSRLIAASAKTLTCWDTESGAELWVWENPEKYSPIQSIDCSPDGKKIALAVYETIFILDASTGRERISQKNRDRIGSVAFSADGKMLVSSGVKVWDAETLSEIQRVSRYVSDPVLSPDGKAIALADHRTIKFCDLETGVELFSASGHTGDINGLVFSPDGKRLVSGSSDSSARVWDIASGKEIAQFIGFTDGEWVVITPDGYYNASLNGDRYLNVRVDDRVYGIDQYRRQFYRPDIVQKALSGDAYQDAVLEAGVSLKDAAAFVPPDIAILSIKEGQAFSAPGTELSVTVTDPNREITDVWVAVNGVLAAGRSASRSAEAAELSITGRDRQLSFTIPVAFEDGENTIEVFASNGIAEGWAVVNCTAQVPQQLPDLWILAIGVNEYESPRLKDLSWAVNDAEELVKVFAGQQGKRYGKVNARILVDGELGPTARRVRESFSWFEQAQSRDLCILFIAGHAVNDENGDYYFLPSDAVFGEDGGLEGGTAISYTEINAVLDMNGRKLFFLDTCHSAGAGKTKRADASSFMRQAKEYYPVIFSSSRGNEESLESEEYQHGLFTWSLIQGLNGEARSRSGGVTMKSLDSFVSDLVNELSGGRQNPVTTTPDGYVNFILAE